MRTTRQLSITLPTDMADGVRARVEAGHYASESEVLREGLRALQARENALELWLAGAVAPTIDAVRADPACARSIDAVRAGLAAARRG